VAVRRPKIPKTPLPKGAKAVKPPPPPAPVDVVYNPPSRKRVKTIEQTLAVPTVRPRGTALGAYNIQSEEDWLGADGRRPQIDPTPSTNPPRPRTLRAGYLKERGAPSGTLWVVFRDGTPWEYYDVPQNVWRNFRRVKSPGRFINRVLNNYDYGRGDF
jgi:hypothetical protein